MPLRKPDNFSSPARGMVLVPSSWGRSSHLLDLPCQATTRHHHTRQTQGRYHCNQCFAVYKLISVSRKLVDVENLPESRGNSPIWPYLAQNLTYRTI